MDDFKPKVISILGQEVKVSYRKKLPKGLKGYFDSDPLRIVVENGPNWRSILIHEICHAILFISGHSQTMTEDEEEALVMALESGLGSLIYFQED